MVCYINPCQRFCGFDEDFHFERGANILTNLMRYCGFKTLHQDCWLYVWLQDKIKYLKFSGDDEFRQWCTYPVWYSFFEKMRPDLMTVTWAQMNKWRHFLQAHEDDLNEHCYGPAWSKYYPREGN